jgi:hypothetical protein
VPDALRSRYIDILFNQVTSARYPSVTMLDRVERALTDREMATEYVNLLLETIEQDSYPSTELLDRVLRLINLLEQAQPADGEEPD